MSNFRVITERGSGLYFPEGINKQLISFAERLQKKIRWVREALSWRDIDAIAGFADRELQACARFHAKRYEQYLRDGTDIDGFALSHEDVASYQQYATPEGFLLADGLGLNLEEWLVGIEKNAGGVPDWASIDPVLKKKDAQCALYAFALLCIDRALSAQLAEDFSAVLGYVATAAEVDAAASETRGFRAGTSYAGMRESSIRKEGAKKRHSETYEMRAEVIEYWKTNIDSVVSTEKAASMLLGIFPLSHRTLSKYVSDEKKIRSASRT